ncbi:MAG: serine hydrolase [Anaerolineae bacterium]|nr:serine hydrolase [Anaerolineae bacterium]
MAERWRAVEMVTHQALGRVFPAAVLVVRQGGRIVFHRAYGFLDPEARQQPTQADSLFDLASLTKLFTATAFMTLVEAGLVALDQPVRTVLPEFDGHRPIRPYADPLHPGQEIAVVPPTDETVDAGRVTFRHLLAHTSGLPAWSPLYRLESGQAALQAALSSPFSYPTGSRVVYSDLGFILLGEAIARLSGQPLDVTLRGLVLDPLGLSATCSLAPPSRIAPTELCPWRGRRLRGEVHDENAARLGGIAGHAGLFGSAADVAALGQVYLDGGAPLLRAETVAEMTRLQAQDGLTRRGLGWALWSPDPEASGHPFSQRAYGHTGFTGTSLWVDPARELVVALLTNRVYYGRDPEGIRDFRLRLHKAVVGALMRDA